MKFEAYLTRLDEGELIIRLGRGESTFDGTVVKTLARGNIHVGVTKNLQPVFVSIYGSEVLEPKFVEMMKRVKVSEDLTDTDKALIFSFATAQMGSVYDAYTANMKKKIALASEPAARRFVKDAKVKHRKLMRPFETGLRSNNKLKLKLTMACAS